MLEAAGLRAYTIQDLTQQLPTETSFTWLAQTHTQNTVEFPCNILWGKMNLNFTLTETNAFTIPSASDECHTAYNV
jgi:hypothetical protein